MKTLSRSVKSVGSNITEEQISLFKDVLSLAEPYPLDELDKHMFYDDNDEERVKRCEATIAKKILLENGIDV